MAFPSSPKLRSRGGVNSSRGVKIFRSLLLISLLEGILWSLCLFHSASACGVAYYERETVRFSCLLFFSSSGDSPRLAPRRERLLQAAAASAPAARDGRGGHHASGHPASNPATGFGGRR